MRFLYAILMGLWRDSFGKGGYDLPIYKYRIVQHIVAFLMTTCLCYFVKDMKWFVALWIALWVQIEWALAHGPCYDIGTGGKPDEETIKRYEKMVGCKLLYKMFPKEKWYGTGFDFCLLAIRYTYPLLPMCVYFNPVFLMLGLVISGMYGIYRSCDYFKKHRWLDVEIWVGFALGLFVAYL